jgi:hypothetical protein
MINKFPFGVCCADADEKTRDKVSARERAYFMLKNKKNM